MVVASFNYNDRRSVSPRDAVDSAEAFSKIYRSSLTVGSGIPQRFETFYAFRALRLLMRTVGLVPTPATDDQVPVHALKPRVDEDAYRLNLSLIAEETKRRGIPLVFLLLRDNPIESHHLREGVAKLKTSQSVALAHLTAATRSPAFTDLARIYLKRAQQMQRTDEPARALSVFSPFRSLNGGRVIRLDSEYNDIMRDVAHKYGAELVDAAKLLDEHPHVFFDSCHFNANGHRMVGELLASRISPILLASNTSSSR
jgi:hypothetical protein